MEIIIQPDPQTASGLAARRIAGLIRKKPNAVLGLATGSTPLLLYTELIRLHRQEALDFRHVTTFNLDEYVGIAPDHPSSYNHFMWGHLFQHLNANPSRVFVPSGLVEGAMMENYCQAYEEKIQRAGGIDLQILGIGRDGHIGFNEPGSSLASRTRIKTLTKETRQANAIHFENASVPHHVVTMGVRTIMEAREIDLLAFGDAKAAALAAAAEGPVTASVPASILQLHPVARIFADEAAASRLDRADYYRRVYDHKPDWQRF